MNLLIQQTQQDLFSLYERVRASLENKSTDDVRTVLHDSQSLRMDERFTARTAAEIVGTAATMVLETRS